MFVVFRGQAQDLLAAVQSLGGCAATSTSVAEARVSWKEALSQHVGHCCFLLKNEQRALKLTEHFNCAGMWGHAVIFCLASGLYQQNQGIKVT